MKERRLKTWKKKKSWQDRGNEGIMKNMRRDEKLKVELGTTCESTRKEIKKSQENAFELMQDFSR